MPAAQANGRFAVRQCVFVFQPPQRGAFYGDIAIPLKSDGRYRRRVPQQVVRARRIAATHRAHPRWACAAATRTTCNSSRAGATVPIAGRGARRDIPRTAGASPARPTRRRTRKQISPPPKGLCATRHSAESARSRGPGNDQTPSEHAPMSITGRGL